MICQRCKGTGSISENEPKENTIFSWVCDKCNGSGELDWIEAIVGKKYSLAHVVWNESLKTHQNILKRMKMEDKYE